MLSALLLLGLLVASSPYFLFAGSELPVNQQLTAADETPAFRNNTMVFPWDQNLVTRQVSPRTTSRFGLTPVIEAGFKGSSQHVLTGVRVAVR